MPTVSEEANEESIGPVPPETDRSGVAQVFLEGTRDVLPMTLAVGPFGAVAGLAATASGLDFGQALALSALVNAGSSQLAALQLIPQGAPILIVLATTFFVNLRFLMYSVAISPHLGTVPKRWRLVMAHVLVDQTFALGLARYSERPGGRHKAAYFLGAGLLMAVVWVSGSAAGAAFGTALPDSLSLDFSIPLIFLALLMPAIRDRPGAVAASVGAVVAVLGSGLPYNLGLIVAALTGIAAGLLAERRLGRE